MHPYTNTTGLPLSIAVFLATDHYDYDDDPNTISATSLIKPLKQLILSKRIKREDSVTDIVNLIQSRIGTAIHTGIEEAWINNYRTAMTDLGYPQKVIESIVINPSEKQLKTKPNIVPIYMEQRKHRKINNFTISGQMDLIAGGILEDYKTTTTYTFTNNTKEQDQQLQGSIYKWINPEQITADYMRINYIFLDWQAFKLKTEKNYPPAKIHPVNIQLLSLQETESYISNKLNSYSNLINSPEKDIPICTDKELWRSPPVWKYYKDPNKISGRSTKNFTSKPEAYARLNADGNKGVVLEKSGEVKACKYCPAFSICEQKDIYLKDGSLVL